MMNWLKEQNRLTKEFIRGDFYPQLWMSAVAFGVLMVLGFVLGYFMEDLAASFVGFFVQQMSGNGVMGQDGTIHLPALLYNNLRASLFTIGYGLIPFLHLPALSLGINSLLMGFMAAYYLTNGMSMLFFFAAIIPHGIFEIPALVYSIAMGLYLCRTITTYVRHNTKGIMHKAQYDILRVFALRAVPLFIIASVIETYVTPWIVSFI